MEKELVYFTIAIDSNGVIGGYHEFCHFVNDTPKKCWHYNKSNAFKMLHFLYSAPSVVFPPAFPHLAIVQQYETDNYVNTNIDELYEQQTE